MVTRVGTVPRVKMAANQTVENKLFFTPFACQPGREAYDEFEENLLGHGGKSDDHGWSLADCLSRNDDGAVTALGAAVPGVPFLPAAGGGAGVDARRRLRRKRLKESHSYLIAHISNLEVKRALLRPPILGNGPLALDYVRARCRTAAATSDLQNHQATWLGITIAKDIGVSESTIMDLELRLGSINAKIDPADRYTDDLTAEKILREIANASRLFMVDATKELNAVAGVPGQPGVREFQLAPVAPAAFGLRDKAAMVAHFHQLWSTAVRNKQIPTAVAQNSQGRGGGQPRTTVDMGLRAPEAGLATSVDAPEVGLSGVEGPGCGPRRVSPVGTLGALVEAGMSIRRGTRS